jgi:ABC-type Mn2+/Zn2+ transport system permease subunit
VLASLAAALVSALSGMAASNAANIPPGPAIVLCAFGCFLVAFAWSRWRDRRAFHPPSLAPLH